MKSEAAGCYSIHSESPPTSSSSRSCSIALQKIFEDSRCCSKALTSLLVKCTSDSEGLAGMLIHPQLKAFGHDETDSAGRFLYANRHYDVEHPASPLSKEAEEWLDHTCHPDGPLSKLHSKGLLQKEEVLLTAVGLIVCSIGSIQLRYDPVSTASGINDVNTFITAYFKVVAAIECVSEGVAERCTENHFRIALAYYRYALQSAKRTPDLSSLDALNV